MGTPPSPPRQLSRGCNIVKGAKEEDQLLYSVKEENVDDLPDAKSMEEEDSEGREEAAIPASDPMTKFNKLNEFLTKTQLYSEFILEKMLEQSSNYSSGYNATLTEEEMWAKDQAELVPLVTGGKLTPYQIEGVRWLISLWRNGVNGILADKMRLGKTIQTIGFLAHLKGNGLYGPYMIIAPVLTASNWVDEISRLVPSMACLLYCGAELARAEIRRNLMPKTVGPEFPIIVTSYETAMSDAKILAHYRWKYIVFDEGHQLNLECELFRQLRRLPMDNGLLVTRAPFQNNLAELWSLLNFAMPNIFSSHQELESWFDLTGERAEGQQEQTIVNRRVLVSKLVTTLDPFLLRTEGPMFKKTKAVKNRDAINLSRDQAIRDSARSGGQRSQEVAYENGEDTPNLPSTQLGPESNKAKRPRTDGALLSLLGEVQASLRSAEPVQVPRATSPAEILEALREIPDFARADLLRAYSSLIRDDRQFRSLAALPMDMRKDWLLMEIGSK